MKINKENMLLYAVTDRAWLNGSTLENQVEQAVKSGITFLQLREKNMSDDDFLTEALKIKKVTDKYMIPFVINDNMNVALKSGADGVHIGQGDILAYEARRILGENKIIGVTAKTVEQAIQAEKDGADYLGVGAAFSTSTKLDATAITFKEIRDICEAVSIPVVAIGGITADNILQLKGTKINGVAVVSAIFSSCDIPSAVKDLLKKSKEVVEG